MKRIWKWFSIPIALVLILTLVSGLFYWNTPRVSASQGVLSIDVGIAPTAIEKVTDPAKQVKDPNTKAVLLAQGIDPNYVELTQDYALSAVKDDGKSPYALAYTDRQSGKKIMEVSGLPMVNALGQRVDSSWSTKDYKNFNAGFNQFIASVATNKVTIIAINDQPDGKVKKDNVIVFQPQLYLDNKEVKPVVNTPTILPIDLLNPNYQNNTLMWDYGIAKRYLRLIEGQIQGSWVFATNPSGEVRIKYNQTGNFTLRLGQYATDWDTETIPAAAFNNSLYPLTIADSLTFYPDAHPETSSVDGWVYREADSPGQAWLDLRGGAGTGAVPSSANDWITWFRGISTYANYWAGLGRGIYLFDTSTLPDDATISAATLSIYGTAKADARSNTPSINIYSSNPAGNTNLVTADFNIAVYGTTAFCDTAITYANWKIADPFWNDFVFNATGIAAISKTGVSKFGARESKYDVTGTEPTTGGGGFLDTYFKGYFAEQGVGCQPKLVVTYTTGGTPSLTNTPASLDLGTLWQSRTYYAKGNAPGNPVETGNCTFTITNDGSITENITISMTNMTGGTTWTIGSEVPGLNAFRMTAYYAGQNPASGVVLSTSAQTFYNGLTANTTIKWDFKYETGTWADGDVTQRSGVLQLTAIAP